MLGNAAKYLLSVGDDVSDNFEVTGFCGEDAISLPYWFDIEFRMSGAAKVLKTAPVDAGVLGEACRLDIERNGETIPYCGILVKFNISDSDDARYTIRLAPRMHCLARNFSSRVFQKLTVPDIIKSIIKDAELGDYFRFDLEFDDVKYPKRDFCVQYRETDLAFISRLMEESGIWYYFEQVKQPWGAIKECAVVTDNFSGYPKLDRPIPFKRGSGLAEISPVGNIVESINSISTSAALMPKRVQVRTYNHRYPEVLPEGISDVRDGHFGHVYEYGGTIRNSSEAEYRATLHARRLWVENRRMDGKGNCASFRAGLRAQITHDGNRSMSGDYLLVSVKHAGGWEGGAYTYRNEFSGIRAEPQIYAPPIRTPIPRIDGVTTAPVGATGNTLPTLNEYGNYKVNMPFVLKEQRDEPDPNSNYDYDGSKHIRLAQPSGGITVEGKSYGIHFPSKRGAEMVLAYLDGNPDRPLGLGFVPNAAAPSVTRNVNRLENVMRSWGGSELVMNDARGDKSIRLATPDERYLELHDGDELVRVKSENSELLLNDAERHAEINAGGHAIRSDYSEDRNAISATTVSGGVIEMNDKNDTIAFQSASEENDEKINRIVLNGNDKSITLDSAGNTVILNGEDSKITMESMDSKVAIDGSGKKIALENKDNKLCIDGGSKSITIEAKNNIILRAGGKINIDAKGGVVLKGQKINWDKEGAGAAAQMCPDDSPPEPEVVENRQIVEIYWTYGDSHEKVKKLEGKVWKTKRYKDVNLHVVTEDGNDGKMVRLVLKADDGRKINLCKIVSENNVVFDKVFIK